MRGRPDSTVHRGARSSHTVILLTHLAAMAIMRKRIRAMEVSTDRLPLPSYRASCHRAAAAVVAAVVVVAAAVVAVALVAQCLSGDSAVGKDGPAQLPA